MSDSKQTRGAQGAQEAQPMAFELVDTPTESAVIKVIGIGGCGGNAVARMVATSMVGVDFIAANTDAQVLKDIAVPTTVSLGEAATKGLGAGGNPEVGRIAAVEDREKLQQLLDGADMLFITAGMGGGTGTGAAPEVAQIAQSLDILTVAVVTKPFDFENRTRIAEEGIEALRQHVDSLITIPNDKLLEVLDEDVELDEAYAEVDEVLRGAVQGIADIIIRPGFMNVDFADVKTVMSERGYAIMGTGEATGEDRAREATNRAIHCPLLDEVDLRGARGVVVNITTTGNISLREFRVVGDTIRELTARDSTVIVGTANDPNMGDEMRVTVVATGLGGRRNENERPAVVVDNAAPAPRPAGRAGYHDYDQSVPAAHAAGMGATERVERLDIPSFLRRQQD